jgi:hypothetical protein
VLSARFPGRPDIRDAIWRYRAVAPLRAWHWLRLPDRWQPAAVGAGPGVFTLTVPQSFVGQYLNLCVQPAESAQKPICHQIRIDNGATLSVPVAGNVSATVEQRKLGPQHRPKGAKQISAASALYAAAAGGAAKKTTKRGAR